MRSTRTRTGLVVLSATAIALGATAVALPGATSGAAEAAVRTVHRLSSGRGWVTTYRYANGDYVAVVDSLGPMEFRNTTSAVRPGPPRVSARATGRFSASGLLVPIEASKENSPATAARHPMTPYQSMRVLGLTRSEAAHFQLHRPRVASSGRAMTAMTTPVNDSMIYDVSCIDVSYDGGRLHVHLCDTQYHVYTNPNNHLDWWLEDDSEGTATMHDTAIINPDEVTGLLFGIQYGSNNKVFRWSPSTTVSLGNCTTQTTKVTTPVYAGQVEVDQTQKECPETFGVYAITNTKFASKWDGQGNGPSDGARSVIQDAAVHSPSNAAVPRSLPYTVWWV